MRARVFIPSLLALSCAAAVAQQSPAAQDVARDAQLQQHIERGLKDGTLTSQEAARLQQEQAAVDALQAKALRDGRLSPQEQQRLREAQNRLNYDVYKDRTNAQHGNPNDPTARRLETDVQRDAGEERRIQQGLQQGTLSPQQAARLQAGQAHVDRLEGQAAQHGHISPGEQAHILQNEDQQSRDIHRDKTDGAR